MKHQQHALLTPQSSPVSGRQSTASIRVASTGVYLVTGASSGIGRATAVALIERGCEVMVVARRQERLGEIESSAPALVRVVAADLGTPAGVAAVVAQARRHDTIAGVVHAAGSPIVPMPYTDLEPQALAADLAVHVGAPIALNRALADRLVGGRIAYVDSYSATTLRQGWSGYSIVKAAAQMAARAARAELDEVSVVRIFPGGVRTDLVEAVLTSPSQSPAVDSFRSMQERGELSPPDVVGEFIAKILLDATEVQLSDRETWDFTKASDRDFV